MTKLRIFFLVFATLFFVRFADAQSPEVTGGMTTSANLAGTGIAVQSVQLQRLVWNVQGKVTACTIELDTAPDDSTWSAGGAISNRTCTGGGDTGNINVTANYVRIVVTISGGGTINVSYRGIVGGSAPIVFAGVPSGSCSASQLAVDQANGNVYSCDAGSWAIISGGGGISGLTTGFFSEAASPTSLKNAPCDDGVTTLGTITCSEPVAVTGALSATAGFSSTADGVHAGQLTLVGNTTAPAVASNTFNIFGPSSATFTAYALQFPNAAPTNGQTLLFGTASAGVVPVTYGASSTAFPVTVTGGVSGAIPCFTSTTVEAASALLTSNVLVKGGGAGACPSNSLITDTGTTATYTGTGGVAAPVFTSTGTTAGFVNYPQGSTSAAVAPCNTATSICEQAPAAVTSYVVTKPGAAPTVANSYAATSTAGVQSWASSNEQFCGTTSACAATAEPNAKIAFGSAPLVSGAPSTVTISGISPAFTATADYVCTVSAPGSVATTALFGVTNVSSSSFTITGPATVSTVISYICVGF